MDKFSLQGLLDSYLGQREDRDPTKCFHCSDMGKCIRMRILKRMGSARKETNARQKRLFENGRLIHSFLQLIMEKEGVLVNKEVALSFMGGELKGHYDAIVTARGGLCLVEVKTVHSRKIIYSNRNGKVDYHTMMQGMTYWMGLEKQYPEIKYLDVCLVSRDDWIMQESYPVLNDEWRGNVSREMTQLWNAWQKREKEIPPELDADDPMAWLCGYCDYIQHCPEASTRIAKKGKKKNGKKNV